MNSCFFLLVLLVAGPCKEQYFDKILESKFTNQYFIVTGAKTGNKRIEIIVSNWKLYKYLSSKDKKLEQVLRYEQGHFDIAEIYARKLERLVNEEDIPDIKEFILFIASKYKQIALDCEMEQKRYDEWTHNAPGDEYYYKWIDDQLRAVINN